MSKFILTVAEYHQSQYEIDAPNIEAAREMFLNNNRQLKMVDDSTEFIQIDPLHGDNGLIDIHPKDKVISEEEDDEGLYQVDDEMRYFHKANV